MNLALFCSKKTKGKEGNVKKKKFKLVSLLDVIEAEASYGSKKSDGNSHFLPQIEESDGSSRPLPQTRFAAGLDGKPAPLETLMGCPGPCVFPFPQSKSK